MQPYEYICSDMETIIYIGLTQSIFSSILIMMKKPKQLSDKIIGSLIALLGFQLLTQLIGIYIDDLRLSSAIFFRGIPFTFGPLIYLYTKKLTSGEQKLHKSEFKHFYILAIIPLVRFSAWLFADLEYFFDVGTGPVLNPLGLYIFSVSLILHLSYYLIITYKHILRFEKNISNTVSFDLEKINLQWLKTINYIFFCGILSGIIILLYSRVYLQAPSGFGKYLPTVIITVFSYAYSLFAFRQQGINERILILKEEEIKEKPKYERSGLKEEEADSYVKQLLDFMREKKSFLRNDLTIDDVAKELEISRHYITEVLNTKLNRNFYQFINEYRVKEFKEEIFHPDNKNLTISAIAFKCGFNSKSSFQKMFKKIEGITPSEFRKNQLNN